ncbi:ATP-dependent Clp protease ATP-binding subunit [Streptomyces sp. CA-250714]|uniref:ATP-dependent Clp protease ATP-binding subunit n=1 Tax=Streptomyces sp. CA-250714 TaxID=3240060 RepID=UPI003D8D2F14
MTTSPFGSTGGADPFSDLLDRFVRSAVLGASSLSAPPTAWRAPVGRLLTDSAHELLVRAASRAQQDGSADLDTEYLLWAATRTHPSRALLDRAGIDPDRLAEAVTAALPGESRTPSADPGLTPAAKRALLHARGYSRAAGLSHTGPEHILRALLDDPDSGAGRLLESRRKQGADLGRLTRDAEAAGRREEPAGPFRIRRGTPTLDAYGRDLTEEARAGGLDVVVGRADEVEQALEILARRTRNNPVLLGEPGVGKSAVVEGIAQRVAADDVPAGLTGVRVVALDLPGLVAGSGSRAEFEERLRTVVDEVGAESASVVLFIDELHTVVGAGSGRAGAMDAGNILEPALERGELHIIGATTLHEYRRNVEQHAALERRFEPVLVSEPSVEETVQILEGLRDSYEAHHQVRFTREALRAAAELSDRHLTDRFLPDKAVDLVDTAGAEVRLRSLGRSAEVISREDRLAKLRREQGEAVADEDAVRAAGIERRIAGVEAELAGVEERREGVLTVEVDDIADALSRRTGLPASRLTGSEQERLLALEDTLRSRVVGQDEAVIAIAQALRRNRSGTVYPDRPAGSFLFLGPTGAGSAELAETLAELLFGDAERLIRIDMSELTQQHTRARLTARVRRQPYSLVLFDGVEQAPREVIDTIFQVLADGRLTDVQGRTADFRNTLVVMTSTIGSQLIEAHEGDVAEIRDELRQQLNAHFPAEFLDCVDDMVVFHPLPEQDLGQIAQLLLDASVRRLRAQEITLEVTEPAERLLLAHGYQPESGSRALRSTIRTELDSRLTSFLLAGDVAPGDKLVAEVADDALQLRVERGGGRSAATVGRPP